MNRALALRALAIVGPALAVSGCATRVPQVLSSQLVPETFIPQSTARGPVWPSVQWWQGFQSPELTGLIQAAQENNRNLAAAAARVMEARAQTLIAGSALFPTLNLQAQGARSGAGAGPSAGVPGSGNARGSPTSPTTITTASGSSGNAFGLSLGASYELDFWGLAQANLRAAQESLKSTRFAQQVLALSITAGVADGYFSVLALRERIAIANEDIRAINGILDVIKLRVATGTASHLDLETFRRLPKQHGQRDARFQLLLLKQRQLDFD